MDSNKIFSLNSIDVIYQRFETEWVSTDMSWKDFVKSKDLGVEYKHGNLQNEHYIVTDKYKWLLNKLKYGI